MNVGDKLVVAKKYVDPLGNTYAANHIRCEIAFFTLGGKKLILRDLRTQEIFTILIDEYEIKPFCRKEV